jgi:hypothetical protein
MHLAICSLASEPCWKPIWTMHCKWSGLCWLLDQKAMGFLTSWGVPEHVIFFMPVSILL